MTICKVIGHKFRPRYHRSQRPSPHFGKLTKIKNVGVEDMQAIKEMLTLIDEAYVGDVCERCGEQTKRQVR